MADELNWYVARTTGLLAWALLGVALLWGLLLTSRLLERRPSPAWLLALHRHLGNLTLGLTGIHVVSIWADDFVDYRLHEVLVPFASDSDTAAVAWGVGSLWLLVAVQASSWVRRRLPAPLWRRLHLLSVPLLLAVSVHALMIGTDVQHPVVVVVALVIAAEIGLVALLRMRHGRRPPVAVGSDRDERERAEGETEPDQLEPSDALP